MKKIKNIKQLQVEKLRISLEQKMLEEKMRTNLAELKECFRPVNLIKDTIGTISNKLSANGSGIRKGLIIYGISILARKFGGKLVSKIFKK